MGSTTPPTTARSTSSTSVSGVGRDYSDVSPLKGIYSGQGATDLDVVVEITRSRASFGRYRRQHGGPPLALVAAICIGLLFGGLAIGVALGGVMPLPYGPVAADPALRPSPAASGAGHRGGGVRILGAAGGLCGDGQCPVARVGRHECRAHDRVVGGTLAAGALGLTGLLGWTLSRPEVSGRHRVGPDALLPGLLGRRPWPRRGAGRS